MQTIDTSFIKDVESRHFRTNEDTGANLNALMIWNLVRKHAGLPKLETDDLPAYCATHDTYHLIQLEYGCKRKSNDEAKEWPKWFYQADAEKYEFNLLRLDSDNSGEWIDSREFEGHAMNEVAIEEDIKNYLHEYKPITPTQAAELRKKP